MLKREKELMLFGLNETQRSFKGLGIFLLIYVGASLFAAVLTAPTYWLVEFWHSLFPSETTTWLLGKPIDVFYDRLRWAPILLGLPWMMKECKLFSIRNLGLPVEFKSLKTFLVFFAAGTTLAATIFAFQYFFANVSYKGGFTFGDILPIALNALLAGLILGFLEELVMRCLIMRSVYTAFGAMSAVVLSSLFFAYKHFKVPNSIWDSLPGGAHSSAWDIGYFIAYYDTIGISVEFDLMIFASLAMFGAVLAMIYIRTKVLWAPIAMHAGIVFSIQVYRKLFTIGESPEQRIFGNAGMSNGYLALVILTAIFIVLLFLQNRKSAMSK